MTTKRLLTALVFATVLPVSAIAQCSGYGHETAAMSCAEGTVWNAETSTCTTVTS